METDLLIAIRKEMGLSQIKLARELLISEKTIVRWEKDGRISPKHWEAFAQAARRFRQNGVKPQAAPKPSGRKAKTWRLHPTRARFPHLRGIVFKEWLWKPDHHDHLSALEDRPWGEGDEWLEAEQHLTPGRKAERYRLVAGKPELVAHMLSPSGWLKDMCDITPHLNIIDNDSSENIVSK